MLQVVRKKKSNFKGKHLLRNVGDSKIDRRKLKGYARHAKQGKYDKITIIGSISLPYKTRIALEKLAAKQGFTMSAYIRYLIDNKRFP